MCVNNVRRTLGIDRIHYEGYTGKDINIAIVDTGISNIHRDLAGAVIGFKDFVNERISPYDDNGHGTHVGGIIAGNGMASNEMFKGIAPDAKIISVKTLNSKGKGKAEIFMKGIEWIKKNRKKYNIRIVNISVGTIAGDNSRRDRIENRELIECVDELWDLGVIVVAAAGNNRPEAGSVTIPGASRKVITVGVADYHNIIKYSVWRTYNSISKPEIVAPGTRITSCNNYQSYYTSKSGTSMATPIVSGVIALALSKNQKITNEEMKKYIKKTATEYSISDKSKIWGMINPRNLIDLV